MSLYDSMKLNDGQIDILQFFVLCNWRGRQTVVKSRLLDTFYFIFRLIFVIWWNCWCEHLPRSFFLQLHLLLYSDHWHHYLPCGNHYLPCLTHPVLFFFVYYSYIYFYSFSTFRLILSQCLPFSHLLFHLQYFYHSCSCIPIYFLIPF